MPIEAVQNSSTHAISSKSSFCSKIGSIPKAVRLKFEECCGTDSKVYYLVVLGHALQAAAVFGAVAVISAAVALGPPALLLGLIPMLVTGLLGTYMVGRSKGAQKDVSPPSPQPVPPRPAPSPQPVPPQPAPSPQPVPPQPAPSPQPVPPQPAPSPQPAPPQSVPPPPPAPPQPASRPAPPRPAPPRPAPFVPGQPIGLMNGGNNCWASACMQLLMNSPNLLSSAAARRIPEIGQLARAYTSAQNQQIRVVQYIGGQLLRNALSAAGQVSTGRVQEDAAQFFEYLFEDPHCLYEFHKTIGGEPAYRLHPESILTLDLEQSGKQNFNALLFNHFNNQDDRGVAHNLKFFTPPNDLVVQLKRFYQYENPSTNQAAYARNGCLVLVPPNITLGACYSIDEQSANYHCDGFIVHLGNTLASGHYVAYVKRPDNTWWRCDDVTVQQITEDSAHRMMHQGYIYHFSKVPPQ